MDLTKFLSDFAIVTVATAIVLTPRALEAYLALREQKNAAQGANEGR